MIHYSQIEVHEGDKLEDVARLLVEAAPSMAIYDGVEIRVEVGQIAEDIVAAYMRLRQSGDIRKRLGMFAVSTVELVAAESPGPGGTIDPWREIHSPRVGTLYVLWERRPDFSIGNTCVVLGVQADKTPTSPAHVLSRTGSKVALHLQHGPVVAAFGSLLVEQSYRHAATEARLAAMEQTVAKLTAKSSES